MTTVNFLTMLQCYTAKKFNCEYLFTILVIISTSRYLKDLVQKLNVHMCQYHSILKQVRTDIAHDILS